MGTSIGTVEATLTLHDSFLGPLKKISAEMEKVQRDLLRNGKALADAYSRLAADLDPAVARQQEYKQAQIVLDEALKKGIITQREYNVQLDAAKKKYLDAAQSVAPYAERVQKLGRQLSDVGGQLTRTVTLPLAAIGGGAVKAFADFDAAMAQSLAIMGEVSGELRGEMTAAARQMAKDTTFSAKQAAESYFFLASAGLDAKSSIAALPTVAKFAQAGMFDMALATDLLTDAQSALGLTIRDDAVANMENMLRVSDALVRANVLANATVQQFSTSLTSEAGAALKSFNIDVEEGLAVLAAFADQGVKAEVAGTGLSRILRLTTSAAVANADAYKKLKVAVFDSEGNIRNLADIIGDLERALGGMSDAQRVAALESLGFQARVQGVILPLLGTSEAIRNYEKELRSAAGYTEQVAGKQLLSFSNQLKLLKNRLMDAAITLGGAMIPSIIGFVNSAVIPAVEVLAKLTKAFADLPPSLRTVIIAIGSIAAAFGPVLFITGQLITAWGTLAVTVPGLTGAIGSVVAVLTGPVGWIAAGVALLLAWRPVREFLVDLGQSVLQTVTGWVKRFVAAAQEWWASTQQGRQFLAALARVIIDDLGAAISRVVEFFRSWFGEQVRNLQMAAQMAVAFLEWSGALDAVRYEIERATLALKLLWGWTKKAFDAVVEWIGSMGGLAKVVGAFDPVAGAALGKMKEWAERAKASAEWSRKLGEANRKLAEDTEEGVLSIEAMDAASAGVLAEVEKLTAKTKELSEEEKQRAEALKQAVSTVEAATAANRALLAALKNSWEEYEILNTLLQAGIPLADALSGKHDDLARSILESEKNLEEFNEQLAKTPVDPPGLIGLPGIFQRIAEQVERAMGIFARPEMKGFSAGLVGVAERLAEIMRESERLFGGASDAVKAVDAAVRSLRAQEENRKEVLAEINRLLAEGAITQQEAVKIAEQLGVKMNAVAVEVEALMKRAWENIQDIAADAIAEIIKTGKVDFKSLFDSVINIVAQMLAKMLVMWLINVGKRLVAEQTAAAAAAASWAAAGTAGGAAGGGGGGGWLSSLGSLFGGGGGNTSTSWMSGGALGALAIVGVVAAFAAWQHSESAKRLAKRWFGVAEVREGWSAMFGSAEVLQVTTAIRDKVREIFAAIGGQLSSLPEITVDVQASGEQFRSFVDGVFVGYFKTFEEAFQAAALRAIEQSDLSRMIPEIAAALAAGTIDSMEELEQIADVFAKIQQVTDPVTYQIRQFLTELEIMRQALEDAGIAATALAEYTAAGWQAIRNSITGATVDAEKLFRMRMEEFNRELAAERAKQEAALATARAEHAAAQAEVARLTALVAGLQALAFLSAKQAELLASLMQNLAAANALLAASAAAAAAAQAAIDALPEPIKPSEFQRPGGGGISQAQQDAERVAQAIADLTRALLPELARSLAEVNLKYDELIILAKNDAVAIAALNALRAQEIALIQQQAAEDFYSRLRDFEITSVLGDVFAPLEQIRETRDQLIDDLLEMAEALGWAQERIDKVLGRITGAYERQLKRLSQQVHIDLLGGLANLVQDEKLRNKLLIEMERLKFILEIKQLEAQFLLLKEMGLLTRAQIRLLRKGLEWINDNADEILASRLPDVGSGGGGGGGGGADDAAKEIADALNRLKEIYARQLSPFEQAVRSVVDEFADLRRVLGWTTELQALYALELRRVIDEQLESIQRLRDELAFRTDSPMRSIDQFRLAQERANAAMAALQGGDLAQLDAIPELIQRVLELNPSAQSSEASRFLFAWADSMLASAQSAAIELAQGIEPGGANDPFAWLRTVPTAGDNAVVAAVDRVAFRQDVQTAEEKAEAEREAAREQKRIERAAAKEERERAKAEARIEKIITKFNNSNDLLRDIRHELRQGAKLAKAS